MGTAYRILVRKPEETIGGSGSRRRDNIKIDLKESRV
jgi:hypothetical protein